MCVAQALVDDRQSDGGLLCMQLSRYVEGEVHSMLGDDAQAAGRFLTALAIGADTTWQVGSPARERANAIRSHMITIVGAARANALLRTMARHGRLYPGLAPELRGPTVGTDDFQTTPMHEVRRMRDLAASEN